MRLSREEYDFFKRAVAGLLQSEDVRSMAGFVQHADVSTLEHSLCVAYVSFWLCERLGLSFDRDGLIRGAVLHDFFLYDWHEGSGDRKGLHGFTHPKAALRNAEARFELTNLERDIIVKHMWPLTFAFPKYGESYFVSAADKYCSLIETLCRRPAVRLDVEALKGEGPEK